MAILPIYNCFHPVLRQKTEEIKNIDGEIKKLVDDMFQTMYGTGNGVGLAANQVGVSKSVFIVDLSISEEETNQSPLILINPVIQYYSDEIVEDLEGCLSIPQLYEKVPRSKSIVVKFYDLKEKEHTLEAEDFLARVIQHEYDHLQGILFFDHLNIIKKALIKSKLKKIETGELLADYPMILPDGKLIVPELEKN